MTAMPPWMKSSLVQQIIARIESPQRLEALAENLAVTDARVQYYLERLEERGWVKLVGERWQKISQTPNLEPVSPTNAAEDGSTIFPVPSTFDYRQAFVDAASGMFGRDIIQTGGEHAGRVPHERIEEFRQRLNSLIKEYFSPEAVDPAASPKYGFRWILTPVDLHPLTDDAEKS